MLTQLRVPHVGRTRIENIMSRSPKIRKTSKSVIALLLIDVVSRREFQDGKTYEGLYGSELLLRTILDSR